MKKGLLVVCVLFSIFMIAHSASAVRVNVIPSHNETRVNERAWYTIRIYNDRSYAEEFVITVSGEHMEWMNLESYYVKIDGYKTREVGLYFYPKEENSYEYEVLVYSKKDSRNRDSDSLTLKVLPEMPVKITGMSTEKRGDEIEISLGIFSRGRRSLKIHFEILNSMGEVVKTLDVEKEIEGNEEVNEIIPTGNLLAGSYDVKVSIPEYGVSGETEFYIPPVHKIVRKKEIVSTPFGDKVIITIRNEGNVEEDYVLSETLPPNQYVEFPENPTSSYMDEEGMKYNWRIEGLAVGKSVAITYNISRLPFIIGSLISVICIFALLGVGAVKVRTPNIKKRYIRKRNEHLIVLEIKGALTKGLKNVIVKDRVSPLGKVVPEFDGPKPIVRESESGTELIWRLGDIKPRSEIYLTYRIRPLIEAQLKMPRAYLTYRTEDDRKIRVFSKQIVLE